MMKNILSQLEKALQLSDTFEALTQVREMIAEKNQEQQAVVWVYACIIETNSAGLSIIFDRFDDAEMATLEKCLGLVGATKTLAAVQEVRAIIDSIREDARASDSEGTEEEYCRIEEAVRPFDDQSDAYLHEMEGSLLAFMKRNKNLLAEC